MSYEEVVSLIESCEWSDSKSKKVFEWVKDDDCVTNKYVRFLLSVEPDNLRCIVPYIGTLYNKYYPYRRFEYFHFFVMTCDRLTLEDYSPYADLIKQNYVANRNGLLQHVSTTTNRIPFLKIIKSCAIPRTYTWFVEHVLVREASTFVMYELEVKHLKTFINGANSFEDDLDHCLILIRAGMYSQAKDLLDKGRYKTIISREEISVTVSSQKDLMVLERYAALRKHPAIYIMNGYEVILNLITPCTDSGLKICFGTDQDISSGDFMDGLKDIHFRYLAQDKSKVPHVIVQRLIAFDLNSGMDIYKRIKAFRKNKSWDDVVEMFIAYNTTSNKDYLLKAMNHHYCVSTDLYDIMESYLGLDALNTSVSQKVKEVADFKAM